MNYFIYLWMFYFPFSMHPDSNSDEKMRLTMRTKIKRHHICIGRVYSVHSSILQINNNNITHNHIINVDRIDIGIAWICAFGIELEYIWMSINNYYGIVHLFIILVWKFCIQRIGLIFVETWDMRDRHIHTNKSETNLMKVFVSKWMCMHSFIHS